MKNLSKIAWQARRAVHEARVDRWITPRLERRSRGERHPVEDFLFEYYTYRPSLWRRWHPGLGTMLEDGDEFLAQKYYHVVAGGVTVDPRALTPQRSESVRWLRSLLATTASRAPSWGCFGLHEWAMVSGTDAVRHGSWPLRLPPSEITALVESIGPRCTHYDALRFFTPATRPLNRFQPTRATVEDFEQPGCLHTNMDLYKWAIKSLPFASSELVADCFALAREIRTLDIQASPYDFSAMNLEPVCIETPAGRATYEAGQRDFAQKAMPLRQRLMDLCDEILAATSHSANAVAPR